jgi:hypothetical protein
MTFPFLMHECKSNCKIQKSKCDIAHARRTRRRFSDLTFVFCIFDLPATAVANGGVRTLR